MQPIWITMTIGIVIGSAVRVDGLVTSKTNIVNLPESDFDIHYYTDPDSIKSYYDNDFFSGLLGLPGSEGETVVCCRHFSYATHGRKYSIQTTVYDGVIIDEETGKELMVKHYPDEKTTRNALLRAMVHYMTSLGMVDVKPCELNYTYPLTSSNDQCTRHISISCDQQCIFQCGEGYTVSTTEPVKCCNRGQLSSSLPTCSATGGISPKASPSAAIVTSSSTVTPRATSPDHVDSTSKTSGLSNPTQTPTNTMNTPTDRVGTDIPEDSSRRDEHFLAFLSLASVFIIIPLIYCARKKRNNMMFSHIDDNSLPSISEGIDAESGGRGSYKLWKVLPVEPSPTQLDSNEVTG